MYHCGVVMPKGVYALVLAAFLRHTWPMFCKRWSLLFAGALFLFQGESLAQLALESVPLQHQTAEAIAEKIKPQLEADESVSPAGKQTLLLSAQAVRLAPLRAQIAALDVPQRRWLLELRQGPGALLMREDAFTGDVTVASRNTGGVVMIGNAQGKRVVMQSLNVVEDERISVNLASPVALQLQTLQPDSADKLKPGNSAVVLEAQAGTWLAVHANNSPWVWLELAPRQGQFAEQQMPLQASALLPAQAGQWVTIAQSTAATSGERYLLQARLTSP